MAGRPPPNPNPTPPPTAGEAAAAAAQKQWREAKQAVTDFSTAFSKVAKVVEKVALGISASVTGLVALGLQGTVEAKQLQMAFYWAARSVADIFAPAIRGASILLQKFTVFMGGLSTSTKYAIAGVVGLAAGVGLLIPVVLAATGVITACLAVIDLLGAPVTLPIIALVAAIAAIPVAFVTAKVATEGWRGALVDVLGLMIDIYKVAMKLRELASSPIGQGILGGALRGLLGQYAILLDIIKLIGPSSKSKSEADEFLKSLGGMKLTTRGKTVFESAQGTWERIQSNIVQNPLVDLSRQIAANTGATAANTSRRAGAFGGAEPVVA